MHSHTVTSGAAVLCLWLGQALAHCYFWCCCAVFVAGASTCTLLLLVLFCCVCGWASAPLAPGAVVFAARACLAAARGLDRRHRFGVRCSCVESASSLPPRPLMHPAKASHASLASLSWIAVPQGAISVLMCPGPFPVAGSDDSDPAQLSRCAFGGLWMLCVCKPFHGCFRSRAASADDTGPTQLSQWALNG